MQNIFSNKIINYLFILYVFFLIKDILYKSEVYIITIKEKNESLLINYDSTNKKNKQILYDKNLYNKKKNWNNYKFQKYEFYKLFSLLDINTFEDKKINIVDSEIRQLKCFDENLYFKDLIVKCSNFSKNYVQNNLLFKKNNLFHILVKDSSKKKMTYKFYNLFAEYWSMELTDINQKDLNKDNQIITIEKNDVKIKFFLLALIKSLLVYLLVNYFFSILTYPNVKL